MLKNGTGACLASHYLRLAKTAVVAGGAGSSVAVSWILDPNGRKYFRSGAWVGLFFLVLQAPARRVLSQQSVVQHRKADLLAHVCCLCRLKTAAPPLCNKSALLTGGICSR